jgi:hypothetical protein
LEMDIGVPGIKWDDSESVGTGEEASGGGVASAVVGAGVGRRDRDGTGADKGSRSVDERVPKMCACDGGM